MTLHKILYPYQRTALSFLLADRPEMNNKPHKALGMDMGLGKTPVTVRGIRAVKAKSGLFIVPKGIKYTWEERLLEWHTGIRREDIFICETRKDIIPESAKWVIVNPQLIHSRVAVRGKEHKKGDKYIKKENPLFKQLMKRWYDVGIVDEAQMLKTLSSAISNTVLGRRGNPLIARANYKWFLSGTFTPNSAIEIYPLARTMCPELLGEYVDRDLFGQRYCAGFQDEYGHWDYSGSSNVEELYDRLSPFLLIMKMEDVAPDMPPVIEEEIILKVVPTADEQHDPTATVYKAVGDAKCADVIEYLTEKLEGNEEKVLLFCYHRSVIEALEAGLARFGAKKLYGGMPTSEQEVAKMWFKSHAGTRVLVAQFTNAAEGVDGFQNVCSWVCFPEQNWSRGKRNQAVGRVRRDGQKYPTRVTTFRARGTLDDSLKGTNRKKQNFITKFERNRIKEFVHMSEGIFERAVDALENVAVNLGAIAKALSAGVHTNPEGAATKAAEKPAASATATGAKKSGGKTSDPKGTQSSGKTSNTTAAAGAKGAAAKGANGKAAASEATTREQVKAKALEVMKAMRKAGSTKEEAQEAVQEVNRDNGAENGLIDGLEDDSDVFDAVIEAYEELSEAAV